MIVTTICDSYSNTNCDQSRDPYDSYRRQPNAGYTTHTSHARWRRCGERAGIGCPRGRGLRQSWRTARQNTRSCENYRYRNRYPSTLHIRPLNNHL